MSSGSGGRGGAVFIGKRSSLVVKDSIITDSYAGSAGGGMFSDEGGLLDLSASVFRDCVAQDGGGLHLNGAVVLNLSHVTMERNASTGSRGGALNAAGVLGGNTIAIHGGMFINNSAVAFGGMACLWPASAMVMDGDTEVVGSRSGSGAGIYARETSSVVLRDVVLRVGAASAHGGGIYMHTGSHLAVMRISIHGNTAVGRGGGVALYRLQHDGRQLVCQSQ